MEGKWKGGEGKGEEDREDLWRVEGVGRNKRWERRE